MSWKLWFCHLIKRVKSDWERRVIPACFTKRSKISSESVTMATEPVKLIWSLLRFLQPMQIWQQWKSRLSYGNGETSSPKFISWSCLCWSLHTNAASSSVKLTGHFKQFDKQTLSKQGFAITERGRRQRENRKQKFVEENLATSSLGWQSKQVFQHVSYLSLWSRLKLLFFFKFDLRKKGNLSRTSSSFQG